MKIRTKKQALYLDEVVRLHTEYGYGENRIARILPIGHSTIGRWLTIFAAEKNKKPVRMRKEKSHTQSHTQLPSTAAPGGELAALQAEVARLQAQLKAETLRADAYDEMIRVAESMFQLPIRKKVGAKRS